MSRLADIGLPDVHFRRLTVVWLAIPLLLLGVWGFIAPRVHALVHHQATQVQPATGGVAGRD